MSQIESRPNKYSFRGEDTRITYYTQNPGPLIAGEDTSGGRLEYQDGEESRVFTGNSLQLQDSLLGTLLTVVLKVNNDTGGLLLTILLPRIFGVTHEHAVDFETFAIRTATRGSVVAPGTGQTYTIIHLSATANIVAMPLIQA